uniref:Uncharacterized protein n=1 Tax=Eutreptiella gymnastica TaxID=73025 RepID=A0A7S1IXB1_9EUGL
MPFHGLFIGHSMPTPVTNPQTGWTPVPQAQCQQPKSADRVACAMCHYEAYESSHCSHGGERLCFFHPGKKTAKMACPVAPAPTTGPAVPVHTEYTPL